MLIVPREAFCFNDTVKQPISSLCIFGDSTAWGAWDTDMGGWVNRLWLHTGKRDGEHYLEIYNLSISGGTTKTILERFEAEAKIRNADALLFQTGGNDAAYQGAPGNFSISPEAFCANLREIIRRARAITQHIIFTDLKNCDESKTMPVPWADMYYANEHIAAYTAIMQEVCEEQGVLLLDLPPLQNDEFDDGLHPNARGHEKIFIAVRDFLLQHRWI